MLNWIGAHAAEIIAISALAFTAYQAYLQRQHNRISVSPHLAILSTSDYNAGVGEINFKLSNNGLGPAVIDNYQIYSNGAPCKSEEAISSVIEEKPLYLQHMEFSSGHILAQNEPISILSVKFKCKDDSELGAIREKLDGLDLQVMYSCLYGKSKVFDTRRKIANKSMQPTPYRGG